jgi:hypothetical protein
MGGGGRELFFGLQTICVDEGGHNGFMVQVQFLSSERCPTNSIFPASPVPVLAKKMLQSIYDRGVQADRLVCASK